MHLGRSVMDHQLSCPLASAAIAALICFTFSPQEPQPCFLTVKLSIICLI